MLMYKSVERKKITYNSLLLGLRKKCNWQKLHCVYLKKKK